MVCGRILWGALGLEGTHRGDDVYWKRRHSKYARKHKVSVASLTESELVSISNVLGMNLWYKDFMETQWYIIESNLLYQDKSTILLAKNGRMLAGKNSKHIKNRFFLITDKVAQGDLLIQCMGTKNMLADVNTKPVQGLLF